MVSSSDKSTSGMKLRSSGSNVTNHKQYGPRGSLSSAKVVPSLDPMTEIPSNAHLHHLSIITVLQSSFNLL